MRATLRSPILALAAVLLLLLAAGAWFYDAQKQRMRRDAEEQLQAIAKLKVDQIARWRADRLGDAAVLAASQFFADGVEAWLKDPRPEKAEPILARFAALRKYYSYHDVLLLDPGGQVRLSLTGKPGRLHEDAMRALADALAGRRCVMSDLHAGPGDLPPHLDVVAPLFRQDGPAGKPVAVVILRCDAREFLYPLVQSWPLPSRTAETLLVRRDGDAVLFLNDLRHQQGTALKLRVPLIRKDVPAVMAVQGRQGVVDGKDYRGVPVLSALKAVPDSPWFMVAKVDAAEALSAWRDRAFLIVALILGFAVAVAAATAAVWQRNRKAHYRALFQAEAARHESEQRYRATLLSVGDGVIATDAEGRVNLLNPVAEMLTGWPQEEARGKPVAEVFHIVNEETRAEVRNPVERVVREGIVVGLGNHTVLIARDGSEYPIADSGAPIRDEQGRIAGAVLVFRNVAAARELEQKLLQSQKMEAIGQLAGGVAHDFRNQLTVIKGYGEMLLRRGLVKDEGLDKLAEILKAADKSALLTGQLLAFSRKQTLDVRHADLAELVADITKAVPRMIGEDIRLVLIPCSRPCPVQIDAGQFQSAILNLVANARDAMPQGGELTIETFCGDLPRSVRGRPGQADPGPCAGVAIRDTGCGMDPATTAHLFEPFFTTKPVGKGTGLGLAMVYGFVRQSGGFVDVQSEPEQGSTFVLYFPMSQSDAGPDAADGPAKAATNLPGGSETILVVEDEDPVRATLVESLREAGYTVLQAGRIAEAIVILEHAGTPIHMLITDVIMPEGSGVDLARLVSQQFPAVKIAFISGYPGSELTRRGVRLDPANMLTKPCGHEELLRRVRGILDGNKGQT